MTEISKKILAIIPARGGSKSIPGKNIAPLAGKPLIAYTIEAAKLSSMIDRLVVSTDDSAIAKVCIDLGAEVITRPAELAQDDSPTSGALIHAINFLKESHQYLPDLVLLLQPTSPLRTSQHINECVTKFLDAQYDSMISVKILLEPRFELDVDGLLKPAYEKRKPRQQREKTVMENGAIYITTPNLIQNGEIVGGRIGFYEMDVHSSIDIDEFADLLLAEKILSKK